MANEIKNRKLDANFPGRFNKRENRASTHNFSCLLADEVGPYAMKDDDGINYVRCDGTSNTVTVTLPEAASNKGRCICFYSVDSTNAVTVAQNADGADIDGADANVTLATDASVELFCDGTQWYTVRK